MSESTSGQGGPAETKEGQGSLTLTALGAGSAFSRKWGTTCSMLRLPNSERWLIDCGRQAPDQVWRAGMTWWDIAGQIVTHVHGDHAYGIEDFALMRYYGGPGLGKPIIAGGSKAQLLAHSAVMQELREFLSPSLRYLTEPVGVTCEGRLEEYFVMVEARANEKPDKTAWNHSETFDFGDIGLTARETRHVTGKPSTSLEIALDSSGRSIAWWGGDCLVDPEYLERLEPRTTLFFHDCTFSTPHPGHVHASFEELRQLPAKIRNKMVLMHHDDDLEQHASKAVAAGFRVLLPGQTYDLRRGVLVRGPASVDAL